jgi:hypothetical protein
MAADALHCPHLPTTGRVYRVRVALVVTRVTERADEYLVCDRCHQAAMAAIGASSPQRSPTDWQLTSDAIAQFAHVASVRDRSYAADQLRELIPTARMRGRNDVGRELWRSGPKHYGLRWVVQDGRVLWVGQGRPPERLWQPREEV